MSFFFFGHCCHLPIDMKENWQKRGQTPKNRLWIRWMCGNTPEEMEEGGYQSERIQEQRTEVAHMAGMSVVGRVQGAHEWRHFYQSYIVNLSLDPQH